MSFMHPRSPNDRSFQGDLDRSGFALLGVLVVLITILAIGAAIVAVSTSTTADQERVIEAAELLEELNEPGTGIALFRSDVNQKTPAALTHLSRPITAADRDICGRSYTSGFGGADADEWSGRYASRLYSAQGTPISIGNLEDTLELEVAGASHLAIARISGVSEVDARRLDARMDGGDGISTGDVRWTATAGDGTVVVRWIMEMPAGCNASPAAAFTYSCAQLTCNFTDTSSDPDGNIASWSWSFGDAATSTAQNPSRTYAAGGTYTVTLTVTDNGGSQASTSQSVTVRNIVLGGSTGRQGQNRWVDLVWSGALTANVDVYRDGILTGFTGNDGAETLTLPGAGSYTFRICEANVTLCSNNFVATIN